MSRSVLWFPLTIQAALLLSSHGHHQLRLDVARRRQLEFTQSRATDALPRVLRHRFQQGSAIYRVRLGDHKLERVASLKDLRRVVTPFISWSALTPDGFSLLMRDVGTQEVYALDFEAP